MTDPNVTEKLLGFRSKLNAHDVDTLVDAFVGRFGITDEVGEFKAENGLPARDEQREAEIIARVDAAAVAKGLRPGFMAGIMRLTMDEVVERHIQIAADRVAASAKIKL